MSPATERPVNRAAVTLCVMLATIMQALDTTIANVALPYMQGGLNATLDQVNWVLTSYIVAAAIATPVTGFMEKRFGRRSLFLTAVAGFTAASILCGLAASLTDMVVYRLLQGVFGAPLVPLSQAVLLDINPRERHGQAMAIWGVGVMVGPILGPTIGGWLTDAYNWRFVFYVNLPVGIVAFLGLYAFLPATKIDRVSRFDWLGFLSLSLAVGALQMMLDRGEQLDWFSSAEVQAELALFLVGAWVFITHSLTAKAPFIDLRIFRDRNFSTGLLLIFAVGSILLSTMALLAPYLQRLMNYPVLDAGMVLAPRGMGTMAAMMIVGRLLGKVDARLLLIAGVGFLAASLWEMVGYTPDVSGWTIVWTGVVQGLGLGFIFVPLSTIAFATLPADLRTQATALFSLMRSIGSSIGISVMIFLLTRNAAIVQSTLVEAVTPFPDGGRVLPRPWALDTATGLASLAAEITRQATAVAYVNDFYAMMLITLAMAPMVLLLKKPKHAEKIEIAID